MVSTTSPSDAPERWVGQTLQHEEFAAALAARRELLGQPEMPRNAGNRRTASKRALLRAINEAGGDW